MLICMSTATLNGPISAVDRIKTIHREILDTRWKTADNSVLSYNKKKNELA